MNGAQVILCVQFNAKMMKSYATLDRIQGVVTIQTNAYQEELILMEIHAHDFVLCHVMNLSNCFAMEEYLQMDVTSLTFALIEPWITMGNCAPEFVRHIVNQEKLFNQH